MKKPIQQGVLFALFLSSSAFALHNPVQGLYAGGFAGISHGPTNSNIEVFSDTGLVNIVNGIPQPQFSGRITYDQVGGGVGGMLGYKFQHFRVEGELAYNRVSTGPVRLTSGNECSVENLDVVADNGCVIIQGQADAGFKGSNSATFGFVNAYYDFFTLDTDYNIVPYLGFGIGTAQLKSLNNFTTFIPFKDTNGTLVAPQIYIDAKASSTAAQGILGVSYYIDDFSWLSLDFRYITTRKVTYKNQPNLVSSINLYHNTYTLSTLNFTLNFAFDVGGINC